MSEPLCACGNVARYVDDRGLLTCGTCPIREGRDSVRISDVPALLAWCRGHLSTPGDGVVPSNRRPSADDLRAILGRKP